FEAGNARLRADRAIALLDVLADLFNGLLDVAPIGVAVDKDPVAGAPAEELIEGKARELAEEVPKGNVDRSDRSHRHGAAPPIGAAVEKLPNIFDASGVASDEVRDDVLLEVGNDRLLAAIKGCIAEAVEPRPCLDLQGDEVAPRAGDDNARAGN